jgi:hypothetical protein
VKRAKFGITDSAVTSDDIAPVHKLGEANRPMATTDRLIAMHNANILLRLKHPGVTCKPIGQCPGSIL